MRKKLFLLALPALMVLTGCSGLSASPKAEIMSEDNLAHEEIFGAAIDSGELGLKKGAPRKLAFASDFVKIGYQINYDRKNNEDDTDDTLSIRFVAAIKDNGVKAFWHRGFAQPNGYEGANVGGERWKYKLSDNVEELGIESKKVYTSLTDGDKTIVANEGLFAGYNGFIIYTLKDIPYGTYMESYFGAYVEFRDAENEENKFYSDFFAVKVAVSDPFTSENAFSINVNNYNDKHFLQGKINGVENTAYLQDEFTLDGDNNFASFKDVELKAGDSFGSFYFKKDSNFIFFGHNDFFGDSASYFDASLGEYNAPKANGVYSLFVSKGSGKENHVYTTQDGSSEEILISDLPSWIYNNGAVIFAYIERSNHVFYWQKASSVSGGMVSFSAPDNFIEFELFRCHTDTTEPNWTETNNVAGKIFNRSGKIENDGFSSYSASNWNEY